MFFKFFNNIFNIITFHKFSYNSHINVPIKLVNLSNLSHVYFIKQHTNPPIYKIGKSNNSIKRMKNLQTGNPNLLSLEYNISTHNPFELEFQLHFLFKKYNVRGEWFSLNCEIINIIHNLLEKNYTSVQQDIKYYIQDINLFINLLKENILPQISKYNLYQTFYKKLYLDKFSQNLLQKKINSEKKSEKKSEDISKNIFEKKSEDISEKKFKKKSEDISKNWILIYAKHKNLI